MEAGLHVVEKTLKDLEKEITCAVCKEYYRDPKILPCLHYYCNECVRALSRKAGRDEPFCCPECRKYTTLPEGGVDKFKSAFFIRCFKSMYMRNYLAFVRQTNQEDPEIPHPSEYIEVNNVPKVAKVNREIKIEVVDSINTVTKSKLNLQCQIKCIPTEAVVMSEIIEKTSNRYDISFTPSICGRCDLSISAYGEPVPGSPFTVTVCMYMPPERSDKPVNVWRGVCSPISMAVNSVGEIIVAQRNGNIVILDNEGKVLRCIEQSQHQVGRLQSVAVDNEDNIYIIGWSKIGKASKSGDILPVPNTDEYECLTDIVVIGDEVMVINDGYVMVFDKELNYVRKITSRNKTRLRFLSPDQHGNLYISDDNNTIQVISKEGDFIGSFRCGVIKYFPKNFQVYDQHVYVCDYDLEKKVVVFNIEGERVTTLGSYGYRAGISVDQNGILYVFDSSIAGKIDCYQLR